MCIDTDNRNFDVENYDLLLKYCMMSAESEGCVNNYVEIKNVLLLFVIFKKVYILYG